MPPPLTSFDGSGFTLTIIGAGNMGAAILSGVMNSCAKSQSSWNFVACVRTAASAERIKKEFSKHSRRLKVLHSDNTAGFSEADVVLLACKPYLAEAVLSAPGVRDAVRGKLIISVLAGKTPRQLEKYIYGDVSDDPAGDDRCYITRAMPSMAAEVSESMTIIETPMVALPEKYTELTHWIFDQVGCTKDISPELFDAGSVLVGATPAFMAVAFDGILDGAVAEGIKRVDAKEMLAQSLLGMAKLFQNGEHPAVLRERISSPRGTTIRGLMELEQAAVRYTFSKSLIAATNHSKTM